MFGHERERERDRENNERRKTFNKTIGQKLNKR
jgi:hypothetical protein